MLTVDGLKVFSSLSQHKKAILCKDSKLLILTFLQAQNFSHQWKAVPYLFQVLFASELPNKFKQLASKSLSLCSTVFLLSFSVKKDFKFAGKFKWLNFSSFTLCVGCFIPFPLAVVFLFLGGIEGSPSVCWEVPSRCWTCPSNGSLTSSTASSRCRGFISKNLWRTLRSPKQ